jgi:murein DD-endopeptidase MepM/ murein hydrolase activator NlpD
MNTRHRIQSLLLVVALGVVAAPATWSYGDELDSAQRELEIAEASDEQLADELDGMEAELAERRDVADAARAEAVAATTAVKRVESQVARLVRRVDTTQSVLDDRIADTYMHAGDGRNMPLPEGNEEALDVLRRETLAVNLAVADDELIERLDVARSDLRERQEALEVAEAQAVERAVTAEAAADAVETAVGRKQELRTTLQTRIRNLRAEVDALAEEQARIERIIERRVEAPLPATEAASPVSVPTATSATGFAWPLSGNVTSGYGYRWGRMHTGIDIDGSTGQPIRAAKAGTVISAGYMNGYGNTTVIDHGGGISTLSAHQSGFAASPGARVSQGQVIGYVGCTGNCYGDHLHFEVRVDGSPQDPMNYLP